jgi:hypothetical protein
MVGAMSGHGHNGGPSLEGGTAWRTHCWREARTALLPTLPIEVIRTRVRRAEELGLDYRTYAGVRATTGRDIVAFLFSGNALGIARPRDIPDARATAQMGRIEGAAQIVAVHAPLVPSQVMEALQERQVPVLRAARAPGLAEGWGETRARILAMLSPDRIPADGTLLIAETSLEREWAQAARLAGVLTGDRFFGRAAQGV